MPVNFQQIQSQVHEYGEKASLREQMLKDRRQKILDLLDAFAGAQPALQEKIRRAAALNGMLRCAAPTAEPINAHYPTPPLPSVMTILAADGSQINPNRHARVDYCVINVGVFRLQTGSDATPTTLIRSKLLDNEQLYTTNGLISEGTVALMRDLSERQVLVELAMQERQPVLTLTDGPLELFREPKEDREFAKLLVDYREVLRQLSQAGAGTAGYVDRPRSDLVGRMLEVGLLAEADLAQAGRDRPLLGVSDASAFRELLAAPGERSAVFAIRSLSAENFKDELALHFFYLNVGLPDRPYLARVEIPAWVAQQPAMLDALHAMLVSQNKMLGSRPYPYVLLRAHEVAVVTQEEQEQVEGLIVAELLQRGIISVETSNKQFGKDLLSRKSRRS
jgi:hypothetical protein